MFIMNLSEIIYIWCEAFMAILWRQSSSAMNYVNMELVSDISEAGPIPIIGGWCDDCSKNMYCIYIYRVCCQLYQCGPLTEQWVDSNGQWYPVPAWDQCGPLTEQQAESNGQWYPVTVGTTEGMAGGVSLWFIIIHVVRLLLHIFKYHLLCNHVCGKVM
jgi:hypothetical protein